MKSYLQAAALAAVTLGATLSAQAALVTVPLTAQRSSTTLPDGSTVHMWQYCTPPPTPATPAIPQVTGGTCAAAVAPPLVPAWSVGPTITVAAGDDLQINLTNSLHVPTSIVILGQQGGGLGSALTRVAGPPHTGQAATTWPAGDPTVQFVPPTQAQRALSFGPEVQPGATDTTSYLWKGLKPGSYIYETGSRPSLQAPMGLYGTLIVTQAPVAANATATPAVAFAPGAAYPVYTDASNISHGNANNTVPYDAEAAWLFSEIDPLQNEAVYAAELAHPSGGDWEMLPWNNLLCAKAPCYPPAVNYSPRFFLVNGKSFDPTAPNSIAIPADVSAGKVLLRLLNAGLRTHVPTIAGTTVALVAEDGNLAPGKPKIQSEVLLTAGKTYDVLLTPAQVVSSAAGVTPVTHAYAPATLSVFDRALNLTANNTPFGGMQALLLINGANAAVGAAGGVPKTFAAQAINDVYTTAANATLNGNVRTNDFGVTSVALLGAAPGGGTLTLNSDGSFTYVAGATPGTYSFNYAANGNSALSASVTITVGSMKAPVAVADNFTSTSALNAVKVATAFTATQPGVLANDTDSGNLALTSVLDSIGTCVSVDLKSNGSFTAVPAAGASSCAFTYHVVNSQQTPSLPATVTISFPGRSGIQVAVLDTQTRASIPVDPMTGIADYSWVIEQDLTFTHSGDPALAAKPNTLATNFHVSYMPLVAAGCTGARSCGDSNLLPGASPKPRTVPGDVALDFSNGKHYYLSVVPADAASGVPADPTTTPPTAAIGIGHGMGGVGLFAANSSVTVLTPENPLPVANLSVYVFEDNRPTNGSVDEGELGLGGFQINIFDVRGSSGDAAGQMTYDLAGMPMTNTLIGKPGCMQYPKPITVGTIYTCPNAPVRAEPVRQVGESNAAFRLRVLAYQAQLAQDAIDYKLAGMALIPNMIPGRVTVEAIPNADRSINGEKWVQVSTLEGGKPVDTFVHAGEPAYWQEFGSPGFHSFIGFMNPAHVAQTNKALGGTESLTGVVSSLHMDRPPNAKLNDSCTNAAGPADAGCRAALSYTTCYVALNTGLSGTGDDVSYTECQQDGSFTLTNVPPGQHELVIWDQWLDQIIAKKAVTIADTSANPAHPATDVGHIPVFSWFTRVEESAYIDLNKNGVRDPGEPGLSKVPMLIRFRDGSVSNFLSTDGNGVATANELFPLFNWYVVESDTTRYKGTGVTVVYDSGGKPDSAPIQMTDLKGQLVTKDFTGILNSKETVSLPSAQQVPGSVYTTGTTARIDAGNVVAEGLQGFINQTAVIDWGKTPYNAGENGGITGMVYYASTRGFDEPRFEVQFSWEPAVPRVLVNLYKKSANPDGTTSYVKIDSTTTSSWDDAASSIHCPGQAPDLFVTVALGGNASKCYDGQHVFNQVQPAPYDGRYRFPSATIAKAYLNASGSLVEGSYVVEVVPPSGYEIVKEEDKNILTGEPWNALGQTQFLGVGNIFILPDQATLNSSNIPGGRLAFPVCVGAMHTVPQSLTLFADNQQYAPFAGQDRPLCDRKEVSLSDQTQVNADFQVFTPAPVAAHFVGMMLNDAAAEFDPISPSFGEKAALPNAPVSIRDFNGVEILRTYNDKWGTFNGLTPSTLAANVPNPSGYSPNMLTTCMNDPGPIKDTRPGSKTFGQMIPDPAYNPMFSNFCYTWPFMPGSTVYLDTPVLPTAAFASASTYQPVDCQYPDATPAVKRVDGPALHGPWINAAGPSRLLTITALGDVDVLNPAYAGPTATTAGTTNPKVTRHYGFGNTRGTAVLRRINGSTIPLTIVSWSDQVVTANVPSTVAAGDSGELIITNVESHKTSVDTVTVRIEAVDPTIVTATSLFAGDPTAPDSLNYPQPLQNAIDAAKPGDLIVLEAGSYPELVVMWKPVRLQGVGAASVMINATKFPNRKVADWRGRVNGLFGVDPIADTVAAVAQVSPLPGQTLTGGIVLLEPTVLSTEEGAGITVLASNDDGNCPAPLALAGTGPTISIDAIGATTPDTVPLVTVLNPDPRWSNFNCAPSAIDGVTVTGGDAGGGIYVNGWAHTLQIANNRVYGNAGPFSGGVRIGQPYLEGAVAGPIQADGTVLGYNKNVNIHHNAITTNGMVEGNAAAGATAAGGAGGGLSICSGTDNYKVNYNFICGNFASSDGGGVGHIGLSNRGTISFNEIIFNESYNQTSAQNGGGLVVEGEVAAGAGALSSGSGSVTIDANVIQGNFARSGGGGGLRLQDTNGEDLLCELRNDLCQQGQTGLWRVVVTNNIIVNNLSGASGGGVSLADSFGALFNNNTIASNDSTGIAGNLFNTQVIQGGGAAGNTGPVTGVPGPAGIATEPTSPQVLAAIPAEARAGRQVSTPTLINNIIWQNRSFYFDARQALADKQIPLRASNHWSDALSPTGGASLAAQTVTGQCDAANAKYWDIGIVGDQSPLPPAAIQFVTITGATHPTVGGQNGQRLVTATTATTHGLLPGDVIAVTGFAGTSADYNVANAVVLQVLTPTAFTYRLPAPTAALPLPASPSAGTGLLGGPAILAQSRGLHPSNSVLTPETLALYTGSGNLSGGTSPAALFAKQYCNGSRILPGVQFEPGTPFQPNFQLDAAATLDESGNFVDLHFGPISLRDPGNPGVTVGNYHLPNTAAPGYDAAVLTPVNNHDVDNDARPRNNGGSDIGADQFTVGIAGASLTPNPLAFGSQAVNVTSAPQLLTYTNTGTAILTVTNVVINGGNAAANYAIAVNGCQGLQLLSGDSCSISVTLRPSALGSRTANVVVSATGVGNRTAALTGTGTSPPTLTPTPVTFAAQNVGTLSAGQTLTFRNLTGAPLTVATVALGGANASSFLIATDNCTNVTLVAAGGGQACTITVRFQPAAAGALTATVTVTSGAAPQAATLNGTGIALVAVPQFRVGGSVITTFAFGPAGNAGAPRTRNVTVRNIGNGNLVFDATNPFTVTGGQFSLGAGGSCAAGGTLAPAGNCTIAITRTGTGAATGSLTLTDTGAAATTQVLQLTN